ncbi:uncharacterized protein PGTG_15140 [Puccinia graminis f. sp. tritici CRL 75-36-700-3]|uniref:mannan endo-1,4-beta-mannosidase n=1 Tax=Puccinia graminis f. sp. tritici (strain CRL 75-36-700-3 / race SCCL) TaxID=418459 RepID=E3KXH9_PUCGT|nr:uncharacterized protein PGTG_15140 [Puccinia graminis f. sp. tritici CRL 75-36-700-3]EFP88937.2 hypothetical protein PGTG_15140 [Puccinia graminis f. sp. tritici CRL 75-36-700-3]
MKKVQAGCRLWAFCLLVLAIGSHGELQAALNTTKDSPSNNNVHGGSRSPGAHSSSSARSVSALGPKPGFVTAPGDGHLYLNDELFDFRSFNTPTIFDGQEFQGRDLLQTVLAFGTPVTRTYTLHVANNMFSDGVQSPSSSHILGWDSDANDKILDLSRQFGVRLVIPIINQDYGGPGSNWVGNFNDLRALRSSDDDFCRTQLIRHRYEIQNYTTANQAVDWFTDRLMIESFKKIISFYLNRVNTFNGIRIGDDETILAFETGNEMNWGNQNQTIHKRPPPASWTIEIAQHIKSLAPKTLVMDGSFSRNPTSAWEEEVLDSPYVDLFSYHFYGEGDTQFFQILQDQVRAHEKTFIIGEHGFYSQAETYPAFYENATCAGTFVWSLCAHHEKGGFVTHGEGRNIYAYHAPGFKNQTSKNFDTQEAEVISSTYDASYTILGLEPPPKPVPGPPQAFLVKNGSQAGISWRGSAWAQSYEILGAGSLVQDWNVISTNIPDNVDPGQLFIPLNPIEPTKSIKIKFPKPIRKKSHAGWMDSKWCARGSPASCSKKFHVSPKQDDHQHKDAHHPNLPKMLNNPTHQSRLSLVPLKSETPHDSSASGGWFAVRAISADGVPGGISEPVFLKS